VPIDPLKQLIYTSIPNVAIQTLLTPEFVRQIQAKNRRLEITGTLVSRSGKVMQIIEGPADSVNRLFASILRDPKHREVVLVLERIVPEREFPNWAMTTFDVDKQPFENIFEPGDLRRRGSRILDAFKRGLWS